MNIEQYNLSIYLSIYLYSNLYSAPSR